jgi:ABC-type phosphate transport system permease subunit
MQLIEIGETVAVAIFSCVNLRRTVMYGRSIGTLNAATGISLLPGSTSKRWLFIVAVSLLVSGVIIFIAAAVLARKNRQDEAK